MEYTKIKKITSPWIYVILAGFFSIHGLPFLLMGFGSMYVNGDFSRSSIPFVLIGLGELCAVLFCLYLVLRHLKDKNKYNLAKNKGAIEVFISYVEATGTTVNKVPEFHLVFLLDEKELGLKKTLSSMYTNNTHFLESMKNVPLTIYEYEGVYYTSSRELSVFMKELTQEMFSHLKT